MVAVCGHIVLTVGVGAATAPTLAPAFAAVIIVVGIAATLAITVIVASIVSARAIAVALASGVATRAIIVVAIARLKVRRVRVAPALSPGMFIVRVELALRVPLGTVVVATASASIAAVVVGILLLAASVSTTLLLVRGTRSVIIVLALTLFASLLSEATLLHLKLMQSLEVGDDIIHRLALDLLPGLLKLFLVRRREGIEEHRLRLVLIGLLKMAGQLQRYGQDFLEAEEEVTWTHRHRLLHLVLHPVQLGVAHIIMTAHLVAQLPLRIVGEVVLRHQILAVSGVVLHDLLPEAQGGPVQALDEVLEVLGSIVFCLLGMAIELLHRVRHEVLDASRAIINGDVVDDLASFIGVVVALDVVNELLAWRIVRPRALDLDEGFSQSSAHRLFVRRRNGRLIR